MQPSTRFDPLQSRTEEVTRVGPLSDRFDMFSLWAPAAIQGAGSQIWGHKSAVVPEPVILNDLRFHSLSFQLHQF
jgi:hypothetical protein